MRKNNQNEVYSLYVSNIPRDVSNADAEGLFSQEEGFKEIKLHRDRDTSAFLGVAFVNFKTRESAENAIKKFNHSVQWGNEIHIDFSDKTKARVKGLDPIQEARSINQNRINEINKTLCVVAPIEILIGTLVDMKETKEQIKKEVKSRMESDEFDDVEPLLNKLTERVIQRREID